MPKRSNTFQRVVLLVRRHLAQDATVTESKMLVDTVTGEHREVDIYLEGTSHGENVAISIECRDHTRRCSIDWIESMRAKHDNLPTDILILASSSGFTKQAVKKAEHYGIRLLTMEEVKDGHDDRLFGQIHSLWTKVVRLSPTRISVRVEKTGDMPSETVSVSSDTAVFSSTGHILGLIDGLVHSRLNSDQARDYYLANGTEEHRWFEFRWEPVVHENGESLYLQKTEPLTLRAIEMLRVTGTFNFEASEFPIESGRLGDTPLAWGTMTIAGVKALFVASKQTSEVIFSIVQEPD